MFYANLGAIDDKLSCYVMHKFLVIDSHVLVKEFKMNPSLPKLMAGDFPQYKKELTINMLFPYQFH